MREVKLFKNQTLFSPGEKPDYFLEVVEGSVKAGNVVYGPGDILGFVEYFLNKPLAEEVKVEEDGVGEKYKEDDVEDKEVFKKILKCSLEELNASLASIATQEVVKDLIDAARFDALLDLSSLNKTSLETFDAIEGMIKLSMLPSLPDEEETAYDFVKKFKKEMDVLQYILYRITFVKKYPESEHSQEFLLEVIDIYLKEFGDRYGAKYAIMLFLLFYPDSPKVKDVLLELIKVLKQSGDPEWFEYYERLAMLFPEVGVKLDEIT
ncbi:MAG: cyclic nucleotide-binding domain-containing protein [Thermotogaceae bacterium]|nr:cyclic nucleotide-binding domain-containing protein [Thermotogaceae bacterium]